MLFNEASYGIWAFWLLQTATILILLSIDKKLGKLIDVMEKKSPKEE
ncbi:MAG: hypothetical protein LWY06_16535 [Firmicutes bacterium]|nr:hypothetical protein [Bacillota bacterium]